MYRHTEGSQRVEYDAHLFCPLAGAWDVSTDLLGEGTRLGVRRRSPGDLIEQPTGPVIAQSALAVRSDDDEAGLAARVLALEHELLPSVVREFCGGRIALERAS